MGLFLIISNNIKVLFSISVVIIALVYQDQLKSVYKSYTQKDNSAQSNRGVQLFSLEQLANYNGATNEKLYLALLGSVFDVTRGKQHYGEGSSYHYFVGKDGSRAFVSGNFKDESAEKDHVMDMKCEELSAVHQWKQTFHQKYMFKAVRTLPQNSKETARLVTDYLAVFRQCMGVLKKHRLGLLIGRYYSEDGSKTEYAKQVDLKLTQCEQEAERERKEKQKYPPCNMEWSAEGGSMVWCTKNSGGVTRSWVGVPRQLYAPGEDQPRCVCINLTNDNSQALIKEYEQCPPTATSCVLKDN